MKAVHLHSARDQLTQPLASSGDMRQQQEVQKLFIGESISCFWKLSVERK